jgi:hypothetical protein
MPLQSASAVGELDSNGVDLYPQYRKQAVIAGVGKLEDPGIVEVVKNPGVYTGPVVNWHR